MKYLEKIIEYGLYLLVFLLPWQTRWIIRAGEINNGYSEYLTISLYGIDLLLIILLLLFLVKKFLVSPPATQAGEWPGNSKFSIKSPLTIIWWLVGVIDLFIFISLFFAPDKLLAIYRYGVFLLGLGLFWLIVKAGYEKTKLIWSFLAGIFLPASLGLWQFLTQSSFANKWLGLATHAPSELGVSVIETMGAGGIGERWLRAYGGLDHPNILGGLLVMGILLIVGMIIRNYFKKVNLKFSKILLITYCLLLLTSLFFTFSRGAWIALIVGLVVMLAFAIIKKDWFAQREILKIVLAGSVLIFVLFSQYGDLVKTRISRDSRLEVKSSIERVEYFKNAKDLIEENWLLGAGIGNYVIKLATVNGDYPDNITKQAWEYQPVHNVFLLAWAEIGLVGLLGLLGLLGYLAWLAFKNKQQLSLAMLLTLAIIMMVDHWLWSLHFGVLFFWLVMGITVKTPQINKFSHKSTNTF